MDYLVNEVAGMRIPRPFVLMLGQQDKESELVRKLAEEKLGAGNYMIKTVPKESVAEYYGAADKFVLASLNEGFGLAYIEAMSYGLPCFVHDCAVTRFIFEDRENRADFQQTGALAQLLEHHGMQPDTPGEKASRHAFVYNKYSWDILTPQYLDLVRRCMDFEIRDLC